MILPPYRSNNLLMIISTFVDVFTRTLTFTILKQRLFSFVAFPSPFHSENIKPVSTVLCSVIPFNPYHLLPTFPSPKKFHESIDLLDIAQ